MTTTATARSSSGVVPRDDLSYRAYLTFDANPEAVDLSLQQIAGWLREKKYEVPDLRSSGFMRLNERADLVVVHHESRHGQSFRIRLTETDGKGEWLTSIALHSPCRDDGWLSIRVGHTGGTPAETPKVARYLLQVLDVRDSGYQVVAGAPKIHSEGVEDLLEAVCDPDRSGLLFIAATDPANTDLFTPFCEQVERIARRIHGLAQVVVLDPVASGQFNAAIGKTHEVPPWTIRTYATQVDPAWAPDGRRHRILSTERLAHERDNVIAGMLLRAARSHAAGQELPARARSVIKDLNRVEDRLLLDSLWEAETPVLPAATARDEQSSTRKTRPTATADAPQVNAHLGEEETEHPEEPATNAVAVTPISQPDDPTQESAAEPALELTPAETTAVNPDVATVDTEVSDYLAMFEMVKQSLGIDELTESALQEALAAATRATEQARARQDTADRVSKELTERQRRIEELEDQLHDARTAADDALIEQRMSEEERVSALDEARWLRRVLNDNGRYSEAFAELPAEQATQVPGSFEELVARLSELETCGVIFTGDPKVTVGLDDQDTLGTIVSVAWECLLVLVDYQTAKASGDYAGNMKQYLLHTPSGYRTIPKKRFGEKEASSTLDQWANDRIFPVPPEVDDDGEVLMEAHFKLPHCGMVTPRIHYYDHTHASGNIYVGYIGPHLRTKGTN